MSKISGAGVLLLTEIDSKIHIILYRGAYSKKFEDLGGRVDPNENIFETAVREVYEETATYLKFKVEDLLTSEKIEIKHYVSFIIKVEKFDIECAKMLLKNHKHMKHYNEMDDIVIVPLDMLMVSIIDKKPNLPLRNRLIEILYKFHKIDKV
jgi:8-oxo-dGTP pyrophosphatase MutT (NUDIX family)